MVLYKNLVQEKCLSSLRFVDTKQLAPGNSKSSYAFRLNDLWDPDVTGGGHKPSYTDQWSLLYNKYRVISCRWKINFQPYRGTHYNTYLGSDGVLRPYSDTNHFDKTYSGHIVAWEVNNTNSSRLNEANDKNFIRETGRDMNSTSWKYLGAEKSSVLKGQSPMKNILSDPKDANTSTALGSTPAAQAFLLVTALSKDGFNAQNVRFDITIDMLVEFSDPKHIDTS